MGNAKCSAGEIVVCGLGKPKIDRRGVVLKRIRAVRVPTQCQGCLQIVAVGTNIPRSSTQSSYSVSCLLLLVGNFDRHSQALSQGLGT